MSAKKTPLYDKHIEAGGNVVDYAGWYLPVDYSGLIPEHEAVRNNAGLFDVSHMGEITVKGPEAEKFLQYLFTNDLSTIEDGQCVYGLFLYEDGGAVDDLLIYRKAQDDFYLVVNASNADKDYDWILKHKDDFDVEVENISDTVGEVAIQGPKAEAILQKLTDTDLKEIKFFHFKEGVKLTDEKLDVMISRTGYTGEDGFEIYASNEDIVKIWDALLEAGKDDGLLPTGLGCRDTLRFEANMPLYGNEITDEINPLEAGLKFAVKLDKESDFVGKKALQEQTDKGLTHKVAAFELTGKGIPRHGYEVVKDGEVIGHVTTGYMSPTLGKAIGKAYVPMEHAALGSEFEIRMRKKLVPAVVVSAKFLKK